MLEYHVYWQCHCSNTGDTIGFYETLKKAEEAYYSAIRENPHVNYYLDKGAKEIKYYDPNYD